MRIELDAAHAAPPLRMMAPGPRRKLRKALAALRDDATGKTNGLDVKRLDLDGGEPVFRLRIGAWRAVFVVERNKIRVVRIFPRSDGYDWLSDVE